jgi:hypothetical protein
LFKRYALTNPVFVTLLAAQATRVWKPDPESTEPPALEMLYG